MQPRTQTATRTREIDAGLRNYLNDIYTRMTSGVLVTAITAFIVGSSPLLLNLFLGGPQKYLVIFGPLAVVMFGFRPDRMSSGKLMAAFFAISVLYGISFSAIAVLVAADPTFGVAVAKAFFVATAMFAGLSIYGYTAKTDFGPMKTFLVMGMWGLIAASLIGFFFQSPMFHNVLSAVGIVLFSGLTVWQTQEMKLMYHASTGKEVASRMAWAAALNLYVSFIAMFQYILHFMSQR
jgi:FtsH-binding integral membrane protein